MRSKGPNHFGFLSATLHAHREVASVALHHEKTLDLLFLFALNPFLLLQFFVACGFACYCRKCITLRIDIYTYIHTINVDMQLNTHSNLDVRKYVNMRICVCVFY